jgi:hypothetical protein
MKNNRFSFKEWLIVSTYKTPFINFIFSTEDFVKPKFSNYEEYRTNAQTFNSKYITEAILTHEVQTVKLMDKELKSKYLLLDVGLGFNSAFYNVSERKNNLLIVVDDTEEYFEIIFINTSELYEEYSYVVKRFDKNDNYYENNMKNLSFLFVYYSLVTNGISVISKKKVSFLDSHNVYYLSKKEQQNIFKKIRPFEKGYTTFFKSINILFLFFFPLLVSTFLFFHYKTEMEKDYNNKNKTIYNQNLNLDVEISKLKNEYNAIISNIKDKRDYYEKGSKK